MSDDIFQNLENLSAEDLVRLAQRAQEALAGKRQGELDKIRGSIKAHNAKPNELFSPAELRDAVSTLKPVSSAKSDSDDVDLPDDFSVELYAVPDMKNVYWWEEKKGKKGEVAVKRAMEKANAQAEAYPPMSDEEKRAVFAKFKPSALPQG